MKSRHQIPLYAASAMAMFVLPSVAFAQEQQPADQSSDTEIVVTAQRRAQNIQDVPISITAVQGADLLNNQVSGLGDLATTLPNVHISTESISNNIYMRGVGSGVSPGFEQAVATFVDDSYRGRSRYTGSTFVDIDRVEVLRGPQTTYFGNNAIGGAFSVITKGPSLSGWDGYGQASYEFEGDEPVFEAAVGGPVVQDQFGIRLAVRHSDLGGWIDNTGTNQDNPQLKDNFARLSGLWQINPDWSAMFKAEHGEQNSLGAFATQLVGCPPGDGFSPGTACQVALGAGQNTNLDFTRTTNAGEVGSTDAQDYILKLQRDNAHGLGVTLQASYSNGQFITSGDTDVTAEDLVTFSNIENTEQSSLEIRFESPADSAVDYMFGAFYLHSTYDFQSDFNLLLLSPFVVGTIIGLPEAAAVAPFTVDSNLASTEDAYSAFGSATFHITDTLSATVGGRYTLSDKSAVQDAQPMSTVDRFGFQTAPITDPIALAEAEGLTATNTHVEHGAIKNDAFLPSLTLQYEPNADLTYYAKYSRGFKAGGFDPLERAGNVNNLTFRPERVNAFEIGMKSTLFDHRLRTNIAVFRSEYEDLQQAIVQFEGAGATVVDTNVGGLISQGVELGATWRASSSWDFGADLAFLDAHYLNYNNATCTALQTAVFVGPSGTCTQTLTGHAPPYAPSYSGDVRAGYHHSFANLEFTADASVEFSGNYNVAADLDPNSRQDAWGKLNLRLGIGDPTVGWNLALVGKNLTNEVVLATEDDVVSTPGSYFATVERGRTVALQLRYNWN